MKLDPERAEPWYTKNNTLIRKVRYVLGFGCWCCGYETEWDSPWPVNGHYFKWCLFCKLGGCRVCHETKPIFSRKERLREVLTPNK